VSERTFATVRFSIGTVADSCETLPMPTETTTPADLLTACRDALGRMAFCRSVPVRTVTREAREALIERGIVVERTDGQLSATRRGDGYTHAPHTFEL
jgi:hypothetical protein